LGRSLSDERFPQGKPLNNTAGKKTPFKPVQTSVKAFRESFFDNRFFNQQKNPPDAPESIKIEDSGHPVTIKPTKSSKKTTNGSIFRANSQNHYKKTPEDSPTLPFRSKTNFYKNFLSLTSNKNCQNPNNRYIVDSYNCNNSRGGILVTQDVSLNYNSFGSIIENDFLNKQSNIDLSRLGCEVVKADSQFFINKTNILNNLLKNPKAQVLKGKMPYEKKIHASVKKPVVRKADEPCNSVSKHSRMLRRNLKLCLGKSSSNSDRDNGFLAKEKERCEARARRKW
jgi:hypothetical protein